MITYVRLPKLTWTMEEGVIGKWLKNVGDKVEKGEPICEVETEKTIDEIEAPETGVLRKILYPEGTPVTVNKLIAIIADSNEKLPDLNNNIESTVKKMIETETLEAEVEKPEKFVKKERLFASPIARKLAMEHEIDLKQIPGTGPRGRIMKEDVLKRIEDNAKKSAISKVDEVKTIPIVGIRKVISDRLTYSAKTALHVPVSIEVDMTETVRLLEKIRPELEKEEKIHLSYTDILVKAVAEALEEHPIVNSRIENEQILILQEINIGVAVALKDGLIVPVIHNANKKSLIEISASLKKLIEKTEQEKLTTKETSGGTFTISNLGMFGIDFFAPIINPPEGAILGIGRIAKKPIAIEEQIRIRSMMTLVLVFDHRIMDGAQAAKFLQSLKNILEKNLILNI